MIRFLRLGVGFDVAGEEMIWKKSVYVHCRGPLLEGDVQVFARAGESWFWGQFATGSGPDKADAVLTGSHFTNQHLSSHH